MFDPDNVYHIYPVDDLEDHFLECVYPVIGIPYCPCKCEPVFEEKNDALIIVHNSFDGREAVEWANEILKQ